jgi:hypothetical protein
MQDNFMGCDQTRSTSTTENLTNRRDPTQIARLPVNPRFVVQPSSEKRRQSPVSQ